MPLRPNLEESVQSPLIILGSARSDGNTARVANKLRQDIRAEQIDLLDHTIHPFRYGGNYPTDDQYIEIIERHVLPHPHIILASPVYWYAMSGIMKNFVDRFTDLLTIHKALGRQLRGKTLGALSCTGDANVEPSFFTAFRLIAKYLGMHYGPEYHGWVHANDHQVAIRKL